METGHNYDYDPEKEEYLRKKREEYIRNKNPGALFGAKTLVVFMSIIDILLIIFMTLIFTCEGSICGGYMGIAILYQKLVFPLGVIFLIYCICRLGFHFKQYKNKYWLMFSFILLIILIAPWLMFSGFLPLPKF